jgi:transposase
VSYRLRLLLTRTGGRSSAKFLDLENEIRHSLKVFGVKLSAVGRVGFEARVRELIGGDALLAALTEPVLRARAALWSEYSARASSYAWWAGTSSAGASWRCRVWR